MSTSRAWSVAGLVAGFAGVAASYCVAQVMTVRESPVVAVAELVIRLTPGPVAERAIQLLGHRDKPVLVLAILLVLAVVFAWAGRLARRSWWAPTIVFAVLAALGAVAVIAQRGQTALDAVPLALGFATWLVCLSLLTEPLTRHEKAVATEEAVDETHRAHPDHTRRIVFDQQGHGRTPDTSRTMSYEQFADDAAALLRALQVERVDVMGYSQGGGVALQLALRHPMLVNKLVSLSATYRKDGWYPSALAGIEGVSADDVCRYARREGVQGAHAGRRGVRRLPRKDEGPEHRRPEHQRRADAFDFCEDDGHRR